MKSKRRNPVIAMDGTWNRLAGGKSRAICAMEVFTILFYF